MEGENNGIREGNGSSAGPIIGIIIVLAAVVLGGLYFWGERGADEPILENGEAVENIETEDGENATSSVEAGIDADIEIYDVEYNAS